MSNKIKQTSHLRAYRENLGLSQQAFTNRFNEYINANKLNVKNISYATLSRWENGIIEPKQAVWDALARFLNTVPSNIKGFIPTFAEKQLQVETLIVDFYQPYIFTSSYAEIDKDFLIDTLGDKLDVFIDSSLYTNIDLSVFDVTSSLKYYLKTNYPSDFSELKQTFDKIEFDNNDFDDILQLEQNEIRYHLPFLDSLTKKLNDDNYSLYTVENLKLIVQYLNDSSEDGNENGDDPLAEKMSKLDDFHFRNVEFPLIKLTGYLKKIDFDPTDTEKVNILKEERKIKNAFEQYLNRLNDLFE
ncbi:helix-turn-helix domain-containing protein [Levilactobacillus brevis]|uniref:helix-turn-helix domain-containing protein n=1 Tax=Levilactobacillus brevis TaxID=1580 RepID=UPI000E099913|nr:helix-turn-helix transcriptional regulator [Levilactobacillus brevis]MCT3583783.1 XRE family transcriptional regulator [Levilactobacillus brevis]RDG03669.1 hypothetical protein DQM21_08630 [Levilactobacillus brevis]